mmetsp:Transcript_7726/g.20058  ORF Transcript_7726/g.20058 Transcript_7726/m.20058 type:complete len:494 (-) Transcript_7726:549-2030(-)
MMDVRDFAERSRKDLLELEKEVQQWKEIALDSVEDASYRDCADRKLCVKYDTAPNGQSTSVVELDVKVTADKLVDHIVDYQKRREWSPYLQVPEHVYDAQNSDPLSGILRVDSRMIGLPHPLPLIKYYCLSYVTMHVDEEGREVFVITEGSHIRKKNGQVVGLESVLKGEKRGEMGREGKEGGHDDDQHIEGKFYPSGFIIKKEKGEKGLSQCRLMCILSFEDVHMASAKAKMWSELEASVVSRPFQLVYSPRACARMLNFIRVAVEAVQPTLSVIACNEEEAEIVNCVRDRMGLMRTCRSVMGRRGQNRHGEEREGKEGEGERGRKRRKIDPVSGSCSGSSSSSGGDGSEEKEEERKNGGMQMESDKANVRGEEREENMAATPPSPSPSCPSPSPPLSTPPPPLPPPNFAPSPLPIADEGFDEDAAAYASSFFSLAFAPPSIFGCASFAADLAEFSTGSISSSTDAAASTSFFATSPPSPSLSAEQGDSIPL